MTEQRPTGPSNMFTPWGRADWQTTYSPEVTFLSTPSHGGFKVTGAARDRIPDAERNSAWLAPFSDDIDWYEEDCDWVIVLRNLPELFTATELSRLERQER